MLSFKFSLREGGIILNLYVAIFNFKVIIDQKRAAENISDDGEEPQATVDDHSEEAGEDGQDDPIFQQPHDNVVENVENNQPEGTSYRRSSPLSLFEESTDDEDFENYFKKSGKKVLLILAQALIGST